jgi:hypothetical protein
MVSRGKSDGVALNPSAFLYNLFKQSVDQLTNCDVSRRDHPPQFSRKIDRFSARDYVDFLFYGCVSRVTRAGRSQPFLRLARVTRVGQD